jgi:hypothetical protein
MRAKGELVEALTVERFTRYERVDTRPNDGPDWWAAYAHLGLAKAVVEVVEPDGPHSRFQCQRKADTETASSAGVG